jgi:hypothetical protein
VIQSISGVDFATVYENSLPVLIDGEVPGRYISAEDLITNKLASGPGRRRCHPESTTSD